MKFLGNKILGIALWVILVFGTTTGCSLRDDYSDCPINVSFEFVYTLNPESKDFFIDQIDYLSLLIYDNNGVLVEQKNFSSVAPSSNVMAAPNATRATLESGNRTSLFLKPGEYTVVAWANHNSNDYFITNVHDMSLMRLELHSSASGIVDSAPSSLFNGMAKLNVKIQKSQNKVVALTKNTNEIRVVINQKGGSNVSLSDYSVSITSKNSTYRYDNSIVGEKLIQYIPQYSLPSLTSVQADFNIMRLFPGDDTRIIIASKDGTEIYSESLTDKIMQDPNISTQEDFDRHDRYTLVYEVELDSAGGVVGVEFIQINDWDVLGSGVGI